MSACKVILIASFVFATSCATTTREKIIQNIVIASAIGFAVGSTKETNKFANGMMYGGVAGSIAGAATSYLSNIDSENTRLNTENTNLKAELDKIYSPNLIQKTDGFLNSKIPEKYKNMINPGEWKIYSMDQWIDDGENRLIHQDKIMELTPPSLTPIQLPILKERERK